MVREWVGREVIGVLDRRVDGGDMQSRVVCTHLDQPNSLKILPHPLLAHPIPSNPRNPK